MRAVSVSQLNGYIGRVLSTDPILMNVSVEGEISNLTKHSSGHIYFSLKDENSRISCFLGRDRAAALRYDISEGMEVTAFGSVSVYERNGSYSLYVRDLQAKGEGALKQAFENLKKKLAQEGLFDEAHKRPIPAFPRRIGVLTSPTGAAVRDIVTAVRRRNPLIDILIYPCLVQGSEAAASISEGIRHINERFSDIDVLIVGRGGGSAEDLWSYNEESVARAIYDSAIPVISAVGHETDTTISDLVADLRGSTPTAAAELAAPHIAPLLDSLEACSADRLHSQMKALVQRRSEELESLRETAQRAAISRLSDASLKLEALKLAAEAADPENVLSRGYAMTKSGDGRWLDRAALSSPGDTICVLYADGELECTVRKVDAYERD